MAEPKFKDYSCPAQVKKTRFNYSYRFMIV